MFQDIFRKFGLDHNCAHIYSPNAYVVYEVKHYNHSEVCKPYFFNY